MSRTIFRFLSPLIPGVLAAATFFAADRAAAAPQLQAKDPVASAFMLPPGVNLTPKQIEAYNQMRQQMQPLLQSALDEVASAEGETDQLQAVKEVRRIREQIRMAIMMILSTRPPDAPRTAGHKPASKKKAQHAKDRRNKRHHANRRGHARKKPPAAKPAPRPVVRRPAPPRRPAAAKKPAAWQHVKKKKPAAWQKVKK